MSNTNAGGWPVKSDLLVVPEVLLVSMPAAYDATRSHRALCRHLDTYKVAGMLAHAHVCCQCQACLHLPARHVASKASWQCVM